MSFSCAEARERFERYGQDVLSGEERRAVREHLRDCAPCRAEGAADPGLFFGSIEAEEVTPEETARVLSAVRAGIQWKKSERRLERAPARRRAVAAASAAVIVALTLALPGGPGSGRTEKAPRAAAAAPTERTEFLPAAFPPAPERGAALPGEKHVPANATIYDWNPGGEEPRVVWIVDRSLDI